MGCNTSAPSVGDAYVAHETESQRSSPSLHTTERRNSGKGGSLKGSLKGGSLRRSVTETKISQALLKKKMENALADKPLTFEKILLKFDKMRSVVGYIRAVFDDVAVKGHLDHDGLQAIMGRLGADMNLSEMLDLFDFINVQEQKTISIKEFLVALTIGVVLDAIPSLINPPMPEKNTGVLSSTSNDAAEIKQSISGFQGHQHEVKEMLTLIVSAYLIFDPHGKGYIERSGIEQTLDEHGANIESKGVSKSNAVLSQQRWAEMVRELPAVLFGCAHRCT
jgi:Ca2+-binding EF-hand superfamily protein